MTEEKEKDKQTWLEEVTKQFSDLAISRPPPKDQLRWKSIAEKSTREELHSFLILAYCKTCDYSEYMVRFFWKKEARTGAQILKRFHYDKHPHKVEIAFVRVPDSSPFLDVPICSNCGREHTYRAGQGLTTPCWKFESKPVDATFKWFNMVMGVLGYTIKLDKTGELEGIDTLPALEAKK